MEKKEHKVDKEKVCPADSMFYCNWIGWAGKKVGMTLSNNFIISNRHGFVVMLFCATSISD